MREMGNGFGVVTGKPGALATESSMKSTWASACEG